MSRTRFSRRDMLKMGGAAGAGSLLAGCGTAGKIAAAVSGCAKLTDIVVAAKVVIERALLLDEDDHRTPARPSGAC